MNIRKGLSVVMIAAALAAAAFALPVGSYASEITAEASATDEMSVSSADAVSASDHMLSYSLNELCIDYFGLKMLVPELEQSFSAAESSSELYEKLYEDYGISSLEDILDYTDYYGGTSCYLYNGTSANGDISMTVAYSEGNYSHFIGDYTKLSADEINDLCSCLDFLGTGDGVYPMSINGKTFLYQTAVTEDQTEYVLSTIVGGGKYEFYINHVSVNDADANRIDDILNSITVRGTSRGNYGVASKKAVTILSICCGALLALVALLGFFIIRFNAFAKAAGSSFSIIGFNMPPKELPAPEKSDSKKDNNKRNNK